MYVFYLTISKILLIGVSLFNIITARTAFICQPPESSEHGLGGGGREKSSGGTHTHIYIYI